MHDFLIPPYLIITAKPFGQHSGIREKKYLAKPHEFVLRKDHDSKSTQMAQKYQTPGENTQLLSQPPHKVCA